MADTVNDLTTLQLDVDKLKQKPQKKPLFDLADGESTDVLFTLDTCTHCDDYKDQIKDKLASGEVQELEISSDPKKGHAQENLEIMKKIVSGEELYFPTRVTVEKVQEGLRLCEVNTETGKKDKCRIMKD